MSTALAKPGAAPPTPNVDLSRYSGAEKAAIVMLSLGDEAQKLLAVLDEEEIKEISQAMAGLGMVPAPVVEALVVEFVQKMSGAGSIMVLVSVVLFVWQVIRFERTSAA